MNFETFFANTDLILTEGSVYERLRRHPAIQFDPFLAHATLVYDPGSAQILEQVHREYLDVGQHYHLPMLALADTWRASRERIEHSAFHDRAVNQDNIRFLRAICASYASTDAPIFVGADIGPRGDAYKPAEALDKERAALFHAYQIEAIAETNPDYILAATLPAFSEAFGIAIAMARVASPYILSFVVRSNGQILDGTPLHRAIQEIDSSVARPPFGYQVNCVHPAVFSQALVNDEIAKHALASRVIGLQANTSSKSPEELDGLAELDSEEPEPFGALMAGIHREFGARILGGCCGTDTRHIESIARNARATKVIDASAV
ncbi:MAG: homocysteine S-methyltransferase family protein [Chloroflexi bacterium]|nr:homocysteine S-methyltransferase family protein [Chloroflexota bacterium]